MDATFERTGEEGILSFCMQTKNRKCHHKYIDAAEKAILFPDRRSFPENIPA